MVDTHGVVSGQGAELAKQIQSLISANERDQARLSRATSTMEIGKLNTRINNRRVEIAKLTKQLSRVTKP